MTRKTKILFCISIAVWAALGTVFVVNHGEFNKLIADDVDDTVSRVINGSDQACTDSECTVAAEDPDSTDGVNRYFKNYYNRFEMYNVGYYGDSSFGTAYYGSGTHIGYVGNITPIYGLSKITVDGTYKAYVVLSNENGDSVTTAATVMSGTTDLVVDLTDYETPTGGPYRFFKVMADLYEEVVYPSGIVSYDYCYIATITYEYSRSACKAATEN